MRAANGQATTKAEPPPDFLNYGAPGEDAVGQGVLKDLRAAFFAPGSEDTPEIRQELGKRISPIYFIPPKLPPTLLTVARAFMSWILIPLRTRGGATFAVAK